ncbi:MAG: carbohydrate kinase [Bacteroidales bacterium]|nr:carbohydrate kinase [Bacteroidales bacterium]
MRKAIGIGETVLDIVFRNNQPQAAVPGGSTFNSMISLGRCGVPADFLSEFGDDRVGIMIKDFMKENGVISDHVNLLKSKTPLSLAFLDEKNDAQYIFYRDAAEDRPDFVYPEIEKDDVVLFGSFYALNPACRPLVKRFLEHAKGKGAILYYDVNFRPSHVKDLGHIGNALWENIELADVVRGSNEDFITLFGIGDAREVFDSKISSLCSNFICTYGSAPLKIYDSGGFVGDYPVAPIETVSTIGAGDNFNAGFIYGLVKDGITGEMLRGGLSKEQWDDLVACAQSFSASCCQSAFNYVTPEFAASHKL